MGAHTSSYFKLTIDEVVKEFFLENDFTYKHSAMLFRLKQSVLISKPRDFTIARKILFKGLRGIDLDYLSNHQFFMTVEPFLTYALEALDIVKQDIDSEEILKEIKKMKSLIRQFLYRSKRLPNRGLNTIANRGVNHWVLNAETITNILTTKIQSFWNKPFVIQNTLNNYAAHYKDSTQFETDFSEAAAAVDKKTIILFQILEYAHIDDYKNAHVCIGIYIPKCFGLNPSVIIINSSLAELYSKDILKAFKDAKTVTFIPEMLDTDIKDISMQRNDEKCFGMGQCQHWTFMSAYVFMKYFAKYATEYTLGHKPVFKQYLETIWTDLVHSGETVSQYNDLQREIGLLGGSRKHSKKLRTTYF